MKRFWVVLPILLALLLVIVLVPMTAPSSLDAARARWDARTFTSYRMSARYYQNSGTCTQDISVEGDAVTEVHSGTNCDTPLTDIEYPTVTDILNYLQAKTEEFEATRVCESAECACDIPEAPVARYAVADYPRNVEIRPIFEARSRSGLFYTSPSCAALTFDWSSIEIMSVTPE